MPVYNRTGIITALDRNINAFTDYIKTLDKDGFETAPNGKWTAGQNLDHLIRSIKPLQLAFILPGFVLKMAFGKANRPSKTYEDLVEKYISKLDSSYKLGKAFIPPPVPFSKKEFMLHKYADQKEKLIRKIHRKSEEELDMYILPHPLLGKITLREMLYFTIYHNEHHLTLLQKRAALS